MSLTVDENGYLQPLGVKVISDNRYDLIPQLKKYTEHIPGRAGEYSFGCDLQPRVIRMLVGRRVSTNSADPNYRAIVIRQLAAQLNPLQGEQNLSFADEPGKVYVVELADAINISREREYLEFLLAFQMMSPYIRAVAQSSLIGSGTAVNNGNIETAFIVTIQGPVTDPSVVVGSYTMTYTGEVPAGQALIIDTDKMIANLNDDNALANFNGVFPKLAVGNNSITAAAAGTTTITWYNRWL